MTNIEKDFPLASWTSWLVGGPAEFYTAPKNKQELIEAMEWSHREKQAITVLGQGTNVLIHDRGISGLVIHMKDFNQVGSKEEGDRLVVTAEAGAAKSEVLKIFMKYRLAPAVFLAGLPGDVGGGVVMNAGIGLPEEPREFCEIVEGFEVLRLEDDGTVNSYFFNRSNTQWQYRKSLGWQPGIISQVHMAWPLEPDDGVLKRVREGNGRRKATQPLNQPSCGSTFKNPPGEHSGALIEKAGLKGFSIGGAQVSEKHGNFIVNTGNATAEDIDLVIKKVQEVVEEKFNILLTNEVVYLGW